ncbi:hypothetical protein [Fusobacterium pseudoperiodonticum]|uniref:hypothetical protein n=1 Tax=Fusobacterium pseudoperiodonticum TaxID=2663009 RepID=UPI0028E977C7|nr:hypothetical protein [Fusobacterium pseudoperiodonticum]
MKEGTKIEIKTNYAGVEKKAIIECIKIDNFGCWFKREGKRNLILADKNWFKSENRKVEVIGG